MQARMSAVCDIEAHFSCCYTSTLCKWEV